MPDTTLRGFPIPLDSDPVADGAAATRALGVAVNDRVGSLATGSVVINLAAASSGSAAVAFPAGRFSGAPKIVATVVGSTSFFASASTPDLDGSSITVRHFDNTAVTASVTVHWIAIEQ